MKYVAVLLFITLSQNLMSQEEFVLRIDQNTLIKGTLLSKSNFLDIKSELDLIDSIPYKNSISRIYKLKNQCSIYEFFNKTAVKFDTLVSKEELANVEFNRVLFSSKKDEVTYIVKIENEYYQSLQSEIKSKIELKELDFFGEFYNLKNGNVLVKWSKDFSNSEFSILKDIRAMASIDLELLWFVDNEISRNLIDREKSIENIKYEPINFGEFSSKNISDIRERISKLLNFEISLLDFSIESIDIIENSMIWNCDQISKYELHDLCYPYIGEVAKREFNLNWVKENNYMTLVDQNFNPVEFGFNLQRGITQSDYLPTVKWVIQQLEVDLKQK